MLVEIPFSVENSSGDPIAGDLRYPRDGGAKPLVLICHGFNTHKDWGPFPYIGRALAEKGIATIVFNFSHNGVVGNAGYFSDYSKFARNTPGKELEDVSAVLDGVTSGRIGAGQVDGERIGMAGHSRGAGIAILTAGRDPKVRSIVCWSAIRRFLALSGEEKEEWLRNGSHPLRYGSSRTLLRYDISVLRDLEANEREYDLETGARRLKVPVLFLHGADDTIVDRTESSMLFEATEKSMSRFVVLSGTGHTYGTRHPFRGTTPALEEMLSLTQEWFTRTL